MMLAVMFLKSPAMVAEDRGGESEREEGSTPSATAQLRVVGYVFFVELF